MIQNTLGKFREHEDGRDIPLLPMFTNSDDEIFVKVLLRKAILNSEKNTALIDAHTTNWESGANSPDGQACDAAGNNGAARVP